MATACTGRAWRLSVKHRYTAGYLKQSNTSYSCPGLSAIVNLPTAQSQQLPKSCQLPYRQLHQLLQVISCRSHLAQVAGNLPCSLRLLLTDALALSILVHIFLLKGFSAQDA